MIQIKNLTRNYGPTVAVQGVSLDIDRGEIVGLLGHNGAGKTTVMKMLTGYLEPTSGTITVGGVDVVADRIGVQRQIGYLPENAPIYREMLVQEYLLMMADLRGVPPAQREGAVIKAATATGLMDRLVQPISTLSKGFRQRVGIAQAILHEPDVLVLDEPTNGLDPMQIQAIRELIRKLGERTTVILSTHIMQEVEAVCDRVLILIDGHVAADAPLRELLSSSSIVVSVRGAGAIGEALTALDGVAQAENTGDDPEIEGHERWLVHCEEGARPTGAILKAAMAAGWEVGAIAPEIQTLDHVFRRLQAEHIAKGGEA
jgi:ABC-2 type transport system ATP-binding protein